MLDVNQTLAARPVPASRGAPMGRREYCDDPDAIVVLQKVQFVDGDYDAGGAYWGGGAASGPLFCALNEADTVLLFVRAGDWRAARAALYDMFPGLKVDAAQHAPEDSQWWCDSYGRCELQIGLQDARSAAHQGQCDADVEALAKEPYIARQLADIDPEHVKAYVREALADSTAEELADRTKNLERLLWLACGDLVEENPEN